MPFAPQQDWAAYRALAAPHDLAHARSLTPQQRFAIYEDFFQFVYQQRTASGDWERIEQLRWTEKLQLRTKLNQVFAAADEQCRG